MIPTPIRQVLSTIQANGIRALLMGGQACVFYGAAQVSKDVDLLVLAESDNYARLHRALEQLNAKQIAVPHFDPELLGKGHAVHYRCYASGVEGLRIDIMTQLRGLADFEALWRRRTVIEDESGLQFHLLATPDLVQAKKTQRSKDWPVIDALVAIHYTENRESPRPEFIRFWLKEARSAELLMTLVRDFPDEARLVVEERPLLRLADGRDPEWLREALDAEVRLEQANDREYWRPLKMELESLRRGIEGKRSPPRGCAAQQDVETGSSEK